MRVISQRRISFNIMIYKIFGKVLGVHSAKFNIMVVVFYRPMNAFILTAMSNVMIISRGIDAFFLVADNKYNIENAAANHGAIEGDIIPKILYDIRNIKAAIMATSHSKELLTVSPME